MSGPQRQLAAEMMEFLSNSPMAKEVSECMDSCFLYHFEAARQMIVRRHLEEFGIRKDQPLDILDFGYLSGLTQEFTHRAFPLAKFHVFDRPESTIFSNPEYVREIKKREYVTLEGGDITKLQNHGRQYDVMFLGEIIEHLDPTVTANALKTLRGLAKPKCCLVVTTPNGAGLYNCWMTLSGKSAVQSAPLPDPVHGYPHIHLWSARILNETARAFGWNELKTTFYHGREGEQFEKLRKQWSSWKAQVVMKSIEFIANRKPAWRGCFVSSFST